MTYRRLWLGCVDYSAACKGLRSLMYSKHTYMHKMRLNITTPLHSHVTWQSVVIHQRTRVSISAMIKAAPCSAIRQRTRARSPVVCWHACYVCIANLYTRRQKKTKECENKEKLKQICKFSSIQKRICIYEDNKRRAKLLCIQWMVVRCAMWFICRRVLYTPRCHVYVQVWVYPSRSCGNWQTDHCVLW